ncbi:alpha/beta hydrolase [Gordonia sp. CPCC 205515]|uniref:alpha/beta fold hydrolase n=1 Tax=Gordonia sp. CPCC 205515 TaxID=3140791 RepID=UPI003AF356CF
MASSDSLSTTVALRSGTVEYTVRGPQESSQPPVVFIHGVGVDNRMWADVADLLADAGYRSYAPTLPLGAHRIPWGGAGDRSPGGVARAIREFVAELGLEQVTLVGCDTGGALCQFALDQDPTFASRVVFTNCDCFDQFPPQPFPVVFTLLKYPWLTHALMAGPMRIRALRHSPLGVGLLVSDPDPELTESIFEPLRSDPAVRDDLAAFLRAVDPAELAAITPRLSTVPAPISVVWGMSDRAFRPKLGRRLAAVFEQATFTEVPDSRTFVAMDQPRALADAIVDISRRPVQVG